MKEKGFTLTELLGVIIIITAIALITTPIALRTLNKSKKSTFEKSVNGIVDTIRIHNAKQGYGVGEYVIENGKIKYADGNNIKKSGGSNENGRIYLDEDGNISLVIENKKWCAIKTKEEEKIIIKDYKEGECKLEETEQTKAIINNIDTKVTTSTITVIVDATVANPGKIDRYEYSINGGSYQKGTNTFTFENLAFDVEHKIGIKVITKSNLVTEKNITVTTEKETLSVTASGWSGTYDGTAHGITVTSEGATIKYGTEEGTYNLESSPTYTNPGSMSSSVGEI